MNTTTTIDSPLSLKTRVLTTTALICFGTFVYYLFALPSDASAGIESWLGAAALLIFGCILMTVGLLDGEKAGLRLELVMSLLLLKAIVVTPFYFAYKLDCGR